jgi:hypothetical protein
MKVLVGCEESGRVRDEFIVCGHDAVSNDIIPSRHAGNHLQMDVFEAIERYGPWDMLIAFPPCTYLTVAANKYYKPEYAHRFPHRHEQREEAIRFAERLMKCGINKIAIENPIGVLSTRIRKPEQIIQPWQFGHPNRKPTCLWLKNLPKLMPTNIVEPNIVKNRNGKTASAHHDAALRLPAEERARVRSETFQGTARAMAMQWG